MDRSLRPTCVVCLEVPLTVTFTVVNEVDGLLWTGGCSESEHSEEDKLSSVGEHSLEHTVDESIPVSDGEEDGVHAVDAMTHFDPFEINDCNLTAVSEKKYYKGLDHTQIQNCAFNNETIDHTDTPSMNGHDHQCEIDDRILVKDQHPRGDILGNGLLCDGQELSLNNLSLQSDSVVFPAASQSLRKPGLSISRDTVTTRSREQYDETNTVSTDLFTFPRGIPVIAENSTMQKELETSNTETESGLCEGNAESSLIEISHTTNGEIRELTGNNLSTSVASDSFKQKDEKSHLDPGYFTEEGNEGKVFLLKYFYIILL